MFPLAADTSEEKVSTLNSWQFSCASTERISSTVISMSSEMPIMVAGRGGRGRGRGRGGGMMQYTAISVCLHGLEI